MKSCNGMHCKCMNLNGQCPNMHYAECLDHNSNLKARFEVRDKEAETTMRKIGGMLKQIIPEGMGFTFLLFDYGSEGNMFYISSAQREDMIKAMEEFIKKQRNFEKSV